MRDSTPQERQGIQRVQGDDFVEVGQGLGQAAGLRKRFGARIIISLVLRLELNGPRKVIQCQGHVFEGELSLAPAVEGVAVRGVQPKRGGVIVQRKIVKLGEVIRQSTIVIGIVRIGELLYFLGKQY